jgi:hypothetical protein
MRDEAAFGLRLTKDRIRDFDLIYLADWTPFMTLETRKVIAATQTIDGPAGVSKM